MRFGVLGTGTVGRTVGTKLIPLGHEVTMGARAQGNPAAVEWASGAGDGAREGSFADAAQFAEIVINATAGEHSLDALRSAGAAALDGKVLIDIANAIDHTFGFPPSLTVCNTDSLGEQIQREFPEARVVKTLNTMGADVMVEPSLAPGGNVFLSGDDSDAKEEVGHLLASFGWPRNDIVDLGDITTGRGTEMYLAFWLRAMRAMGTPRFNIRLVREPS